MGKINKYNVYDKGCLIMENATSSEVREALNCKTICISKYAEEKMRYKGRYTFVLIDKEEIVANAEFVKEWKSVIKLFKNVIWVKSGGRQLSIRK